MTPRILVVDNPVQYVGTHADVVVERNDSESILTDAGERTMATLCERCNTT